MTNKDALGKMFSYLVDQSKAENMNLAVCDYSPQKDFYCNVIAYNAFTFVLQMAAKEVRLLIWGDVVSPDGFMAWLDKQNYNPVLPDGVTAEHRSKKAKAPNGGMGNVYTYRTAVTWTNKEDFTQDDKAKVYGVFKATINRLIELGANNLNGPHGKRRSVKRPGFGNDQFERNLIVFGAPGTGKSKWLDEQSCKVKSDVDSDGNATEQTGGAQPFFSACRRITFYPTYSYAQFVGAYKPVMVNVDDKGMEIANPELGKCYRKVISYKFAPGPFVQLLKEALRNKENNYLLVVEEINRANAAAVFGDMFQLLDRDGDGASDYAITPCSEIIEYLIEKDGQGEGLEMNAAKELRIPSNLYIWATMNSADQGVFPLDTAFKRRWNFKYIGLDDKKGNDSAVVRLSNNSICRWGNLRKAINSLLSRCGVNEDKLLSSYFVKDCDISDDTFTMKVLMYLWEDAARMCRGKVFHSDIKRFSDLLDKWSKIKGSQDEDKKGVVPFETVFCFESSDKAPSPDVEMPATNADQTNVTNDVKDGPQIDEDEQGGQSVDTSVGEETTDEEVNGDVQQDPAEAPVTQHQQQVDQ